MQFFQINFLVVNIVIILPVNQNLQGDIDLEEAWPFASVT